MHLLVVQHFLEIFVKFRKHFIKIAPKKDEFDAKSQKFQNVAEKISNLLKMLKF